MHGFDVGGGVQHFLHTRAAAWSLMGNNDDVAAFNLAAQDAFDGVLLAFKHHCRTGEGQDGGVHTSGFNDATLFSDIAEQYRQAAVTRIGVL